MPEIGEIRKGTDINRKSPNKFIWWACVDCGKERWVNLRKGKPAFLRCKKCYIPVGMAGEKNPSWKGGIKTNTDGYKQVKVFPQDFFFAMSDIRGYVFEHRLVVAKALGRNLHSWEIVHHKGVKYPKGSIENRQDNRYPENLQLVMEGQHNQISHFERRLKRVEDENKELKKQVRLLEWQIRELTKQSFIV